MMAQGVGEVKILGAIERSQGVCGTAGVALATALPAPS